MIAICSNNSDYENLSNKTLKIDGSSKCITLTGGNGNTAGYRLILSKTLGTWNNPRLLLLVRSRHQGVGLVSFGISTNSTIDSYNAEVKYYGSSVQYYSDAWTLGYNTSTGLCRIYWRYGDYSPCSVYVISRDVFPIPENGEWVTSLPSDIGTTYNAKIA